VTSGATRTRRHVRRSTAGAWTAFGVALAVHLVVLYTPDAPSTGTAVPHLDKLVHVAIFAAVAWTGRRAGLPPLPLVGALLMHAGVSEAVQHLLYPGRAGDVLDVLADVVGAVTGTVLPAGVRVQRGSAGRGPAAAPEGGAGDPGSGRAGSGPPSAGTMRP
jgi:VanZ family protein